ncbi:MAG: hypothetical protein E7523_04780 [Ruminococcaceae bacterium]|nr:hypothetical protein [Oscillospiraceae bacterium]
MKKTLAIILSILMMFAVLPVGGSAAETSYDRSAVASGIVADLTAEQMASVILDWVDRQIAKVTEDFESFEVNVMGTTVAVDIPEIKTLDDVITYKDYLAKLEGDFANLNTANLITREAAGSSLDFIYGVLQFMADNSEIFGKVFQWEAGKVFDYGKVGEYIEALDPAVEENKQIIDFYNNYLIGNDIQDKFIDWVAKQMKYDYAVDANGVRTENFDDIINNGILDWFAGICEQMGVLSADGIASLKAYDLRTTDIYTLVENFVGLVQSDNQVKIDTYYNYIMDTVVRSLLKNMLGQKAVVGAVATLPASFNAVYTDLALLETISGGNVYYKDGENYYIVTVADGVATAKTLTWETVVDFEFPTVTIYTGADFDQEVQTYHPTSADAVAYYTYASAKNQALVGDIGLAFNGTEVPADFAALMTEANAKTLTDGFGVAVAQGETIISELQLTFKEIEEFAEERALPIAQQALESGIASLPFAVDIKLEDVDVVLAYNGWATEDEFICEVVVDSVSAKLSGTMASMIQSVVDTAAKSVIGTTVDNPVATVVVDGISGGKGIDASGAKELFEFIDTDFVIDQNLLAFAENYDNYNGVVGQANRVLYDLVDMFVSDAGMQKLALEEGMNDKFTDNLEKICETANEMMASAEAIMTDPEVEALLGKAGIDMSEILGSFDFDLLYAISFESVEDLWVSAITLGLDILDNGTNETVSAVHSALEGCETLDAMAVAAADYLLAECIPAVNKLVAELKAQYTDVEIGFELTVPAKTDVASVADGAGKDIIMTKAVDVLYEAAVEGVALANAIANDVLADVATEIGMDMPTVAFELKVAKGADWTETLAALVNRVYELTDGIIIACDNEYTDTFDKISAVANAILPLGSLASNCASENFAFDINTVMGYIFNDGFEGDLEGFLRLFETAEKTADVASGVPVTKALINASQHIVDSIFPGTVVAENYEANTTVQETFTSGDNDVVIASNNMKSINNRKADLVPAALNLVREAGILPYFAKCELDHTAADLATVLIPGTAATCTEDGVEDAYACADCGYIVRGGGVITASGHNHTSKVTSAATCTAEGVETFTCANCGDTYTKSIAKLSHSYGAWTTKTAATCTVDGVSERKCTCGKTETKAIPATGHADADSNYVCDNCGTELEKPELNFFEKIIAFFRSIIDFFKNLFS